MRINMSRMGLEVGRLRKEIGMTQKQLAKLVGVTEGFIAEVEAGRKVLNGDLAAKISKALRQEVGKLDLYEGEENYNIPEPKKDVVKVIEKPVQAVWDNALAGVLMAVPVYGYKMDKSLGAKQLPIIANKVEGYPKDKVFYMTIEDSDMTGFRIFKGDLALAYTTKEIEKEAVFLIEYNGKRVIRKIKVLEGEKLLLVSYKGSLTTETVLKKDIKILARLIRLEIML
jgi:transcriptional regulator with XRE-family HTH domain